MSSADMCQCAGCFPARQAVDAHARKYAFLEKVAQIKKDSMARKVTNMNTSKGIEQAQLIAICRGAAQRCDE